MKLKAIIFVISHIAVNLTLLHVIEILLYFNIYIIILIKQQIYYN